jgi:outer membrane protein assembly factor BamB
MIRIAGVLFLVLTVLAGCTGAADKLLEPFTGKKDEILPGTRETVLLSNSPLGKAAAAPKEAASDPIAIPAAVSNANWSQPGGVPSNAMHNLDLGMQLKKVFAVSAGAGSSGRDRLLSGPIVVGGRIYVLDSEANVRAFNAANGARIWGRPLAPKGKDPEGAFGGGLASDGNNIYAATAFGEVVALSAATGNEVWRQKLGSPVRAAPTVADGKVFVVTVANEVAALNTGDGQSTWKHQGTGEQASLMAVSSPAVADGFVVVPATSGELIALSAGQGISAWDESLAAADPTTSLANLNDIAGRPVIDNGVVFGIAHAGRLGAFKLSDGSEVWSQEIAGSQTPWLAGDYVFVLSNRATLAAVSKRNGAVRWSVNLAGGGTWTGPVVGGGRLLVVGSAGLLVSVSPQTGQSMSTINLGEKFFIPPVIANGTIYLLSDAGTLIALR